MCRKILLALILIILLPVIAPAKTEGGMIMAIYSYGPGRTYEGDRPLSVTQLKARGWMTPEGRPAPQPKASGGYTPSAPAKKTTYGGGYSTGTYSPSKAAAEALQRAAGHVQYFGSPQAYAKAIQKKGMANLTDPEAARAFMRANPQLFASRAPSSSVTSTASAAREAMQNVAGKVPLRQYFESRGYTVNYSPESRTISIGTSKSPLYVIGEGDYTLTGGRSYLQEAAAKSILNRLSEISREKQAEAERIARETQASDVLERAGFKGGADPFSYLPPSGMTYEQAAQFQRTLQQNGALSDTLSRMLAPDVYQAVRELQEMPPLYQPQQMQPMQQMQAQIAPLIEQLQREIQNVNAETAPVVMNAYNQVIGMIDRVQQDLFSRFEQLGQGVDPATQAALASLKETVKRQKENLMEDLSRRGLLQSGIWLEMEDRLNKGLLTEQERLLATRLSDLQNQLNQALVSLGEMRIQATQQFGAEQIRQMEAAAQRRQQAIEALTNAALKIQEQIAEQQRWEQEQAWERQKYFIPSWVQQAQYTGVIPPLYPGDPSAAIRQAQKEWGEAYARGDEEGMKRAHEKAEALRAAAGWPSGGESGLLTEHLMTPAGLPTAEMQRAWWPYQYPTAGELLPYELGPTPAQMLPYQYPTANALLPYTQGPTPYEQARLNLERQRLAQAAANAYRRAAGGRQPTLTERRQATLADAYDAIDAAINQGHTVEDIEASIDSQYSDLVRQGIDPAKLKQYLRDRAISGAVSYRKTPKELETERLKSRPFWQKAIDFILPFGQYR